MQVARVASVALKATQRLAGAISIAVGPARDADECRRHSAKESMLVALGRMHELKVHVRGALNNGVTKEELQEIFLHASVYCGFPAAVDAFRSAAEVVDDAAR